MALPGRGSEARCGLRHSMATNSKVSVTKAQNENHRRILQGESRLAASAWRLTSCLDRVTVLASWAVPPGHIQVAE